MLRTKRKRCVAKKGKDDFNFDFEKELSIYCFTRGEKISRKKWKKVEKEKSYNTYMEWKDYIQTKYCEFSLNKLVEFRYYLDYVKRRNQAIPDFTNPYISAFLAAVISYMFSFSTSNVTETVFGVQKFPSKVIGFILICVVFLACVKKTANIFLDNRIEESFCSDYKDVIDEMIGKLESKKEVDLLVIPQAIDNLKDELTKLQKTMQKTNQKLESMICQYEKDAIKNDGNSNIRKERNSLWQQLLDYIR